MNFTLPSGARVHLIGDVHAGRKFDTGCPLNRRGDRAARQMTRFKAELDVPCDYNVMVGDLFDHPNVGYGVVIDVAQAYLDAARKHSNTTFIAMAGNHDLPRNIGVVGAFDAFEKMVEGQENIVVVRTPQTFFGELVCLPWQWDVPAIDQLIGLELHPKVSTITTAIGHWDLQSYGGSDDHLAPVAELKALGITDIYSGHYHLPGDYNGVICTGSMEPYSHAEDPDGAIYVTVSLEQALDGSDYSQKCVRVVLEKGEELPSGIDCFAMTAMKAKIPDQEVEVGVTLDGFDWQDVLERKLKNLQPKVRDYINERLTG